MVNVGRAVATVGSALVKLTDAQTVIFNTIMHNGAPTEAPPEGSASGLRNARAEKASRQAEVDYRTRKAKDGVKLRGFPQPRPQEQNGFAVRPRFSFTRSNALT